MALIQYIGARDLFHDTSEAEKVPRYPILCQEPPRRFASLHIAVSRQQIRRGGVYCRRKSREARSWLLESVCVFLRFFVGIQAAFPTSDSVW